MCSSFRLPRFPPSPLSLPLWNSGKNTSYGLTGTWVPIPAVPLNRWANSGGSYVTTTCLSVSICWVGIRMAFSWAFLERSNASVCKSPGLCRGAAWSLLLPFLLHHFFLELNHSLPRQCFLRLHAFAVLFRRPLSHRLHKLKSRPSSRKCPLRPFPSSGVFGSMWSISCDMFLYHCIITSLSSLPY